MEESYGVWACRNCGATVTTACCAHASDVHLPGGGCSECPIDEYEHDYQRSAICIGDPAARYAGLLANDTLYEAALVGCADLDAETQGAARGDLVRAIEQGDE